MASQSFPHGWISSNSATYKILSLKGQGAFGKVVKCVNLANNKTVALKMIKNEGIYGLQAKVEIEFLKKMKHLNKQNIVIWNDAFSTGGQLCLEFEHLDKSLSDLMKERLHKPLRLNQIRPIVYQVANALNHLKEAGIVHADLKLENIMLVDHQQQPYKVKLIDFGLSSFVSEVRQGLELQTLPYRCPEIILGAPYNEAIDMWSLGCVAAELFIGRILYPGYNEYDMLQFIRNTQGPIPDGLIASGRKTLQFYNKFYRGGTWTWNLKSPEQFSRMTKIHHPLENLKCRLRCFNDLLTFQRDISINPVDGPVEKVDMLMFVDMLKGMLQLDPGKRLTPQQVMMHSFCSMRHLMDHPDTPHLHYCYKVMANCQRTTVCVQNGPESSRITHQAPHTGPRSQPPSHHHNSGQTTEKRQGVKRKRDDEDGAETSSHLPKRIKQQDGGDQHRMAHPVPDPAPPSTHSRDHHHGQRTEETMRGQKRKRSDDESVPSCHLRKKRKTEDGGNKHRMAHPVPDPAPPSTHSHDHHHGQRTEETMRGQKRKRSDDESVPSCHLRKKRKTEDGGNKHRTDDRVPDPAPPSRHQQDPENGWPNREMMRGQKRKRSDSDSLPSSHLPKKRKKEDGGV